MARYETLGDHTTSVKKQDFKAWKHNYVDACVGFLFLSRQIWYNHCPVYDLGLIALYGGHDFNTKINLVWKKCLHISTFYIYQHSRDGWTS